MMHLVTGASASGKSAYAEDLLIHTKSAEKYYIATMRPWGAEGAARVKKHRAMREGKGFQTIEAFHTLDALHLPGTGSLMLECMSNLLANEQFELGGTDEEILDRIQQGIQNLKAQTEDLIIVTNEIFSDGCRYDAETVRYIRLLGNLNIRMAEDADAVTEVVYGIPICRKGEDANEQQ